MLLNNATPIHEFTEHQVEDASVSFCFGFVGSVSPAIL
jgi:hypothetical protein